MTLPLPPRSLAPPSTTSTSSSGQSGSCVAESGIDIRDALTILSHRARGGGDADTAAFSGGAAVPPRELKEMGQTIDMIIDPMNSNDECIVDKETISGCGCVQSKTDDGHHRPPIDEDELKRHKLLKEERTRRGEEIRTQLRSMTAVDLLNMVFRAQEERVATYHVFEKGLSTILMSGNITTYPNLCAKVTASFSVLSDTINSVKSSLDEADGENKQDNGQHEMSNFISQLQKCESEKLNLTAALHLERLRLSNSRLGDENGKCDQVTMKLLTEGIRSLEQKIASVVESINEVLDELRCIAVE